MSSSGNSTGDSGGLPRPTRHITSTDDDGESFFFSGTPSCVGVSRDLGKGATLSLAYKTTGAAPVELGAGADLEAYLGAIGAPPALWTEDGGTNVWFVDTPPDTESPLHRTVSLDFTVQVAGEIELSMSNGECRLVRPGDVVVQRGTLHRWRNPSKTQWSRFVGVNTGSKPVVTKNKGALGTVM